VAVGVEAVTKAGVTQMAVIPSVRKPFLEDYCLQCCDAAYPDITNFSSKNLL
jgi:hypothetical protein